jgi:hypothetical protein
MAAPEKGEQGTPEEKNSTSGGSLVTWLCYGIGAVILFLILTVPKKPAPAPVPRSAAVPPPNLDPPPLNIPVSPLPPSDPGEPKFIRADGATNRWDPHRTINYWWDRVPEQAKAGAIDTGDRSNITRNDYAGAESCRKCHADKHRDWSEHPHRWMNAMASGEALQGDFSGRKSIDYRGGKGRFITEDGIPKMLLERNRLFRKYRVNRTIGSRYFQYFVGVLEEERGAAVPAGDEQRRTDSVLPFGYWMTTGEWVPTVHVHRDLDTDEAEIDPFGDWKHIPYDKACSECHTTWAFGDWIIKLAGSERFTGFTPHSLDIHLGKLLQTAHPDRIPEKPPLDQYTFRDIERVILDERMRPQTDERLALGVTCEGCHLGSAEHARHSTSEESKFTPSFSPISPHFHPRAKSESELTERTALNVNFICSKCHSGTRPTYANGTHTWNSTEFSEAASGHCFHPAKAAGKSMEILTCVGCHDPHRKTGREWSRSPDEDDRSCIRCHEQFNTPAAQTAHTHHPAGSSGTRCMNCHMPKINEGLEAMVRTHRIQSPVDKLLVENNQPNACNLCHLDKPIDWTLNTLAQWYPDRHHFDAAAIAANYPDRQGAVGPGWLRSAHAGTRIAAASAIAIRQPREHLDQLLDLLVADSHLINRQLIQKRLREFLDLDLRKTGYQFYLDLEDRRKVINSQRTTLLKRYRPEPATAKK